MASTHALSAGTAIGIIITFTFVTVVLNYANTQPLTQSLPASGNLTWDALFLKASGQKFGRQMNPNRGSALVAVPTLRDPARSLDELAAGRVVGSFYIPVAGQYFDMTVRTPSLFLGARFQQKLPVDC